MEHPPLIESAGDDRGGAAAGNLTVPGTTLSGPACALCAAVESRVLQRSGGGCTPVSVGSVVITFPHPELPGTLVAPRCHIGRLPTNVAGVSGILGGLRQATVAVQRLYRASAVKIEPARWITGSPGHLCYWVRPVMPGTTKPLSGELARLVSGLRRHLERPVGRSLLCEEIPLSAEGPLL